MLCRYNELSRTYVQKHAKSTLARDIPVVSSVASLLSGVYVTPFVQSAMKGNVVVKDYVFFNISYISVNGKDVYVALGLLG